MFFILFPREG